MTIRTTPKQAIVEHIGIDCAKRILPLPVRPQAIADDLMETYALSALPIAINCYKKYHPYDSNGDFATAACDGVWHGLRTYDSTMGDLPPWMKHTIANSLKVEMTATARRRGMESVDPASFSGPLDDSQTFTRDNLNYSAIATVSATPSMAESRMVADEMLDIFRQVIADIRSEERTDIEIIWLDEIECHISSGDSWPKPSQFMASHGISASDKKTYTRLTDIASIIRRNFKQLIGDYSEAV